ncbi:hypothetical protein FCM35_KLT14658 [Carex littledalei]|uniref:Uncharacterized protein n=1 Tax=Carex littledalei TaxID=544730 RepID=A0A833VDF2_9POAL|nr:hypothetical protein FCM35_KLT14658 [Carex littledalei]
MKSIPSSSFGVQEERQCWLSHYKVEISLGFTGNNFRIMEIKGNNFNIKEIKGRENDKIKADVKELLKRVYNTHLKIRPEMNIISS